MMAIGGKDAEEEMMNDTMRGEAVDDSFERAQQMALEVLFQQCVDDLYTGETTTLATSQRHAAAQELALTSSETASFMDMLAQACEEANDQLQAVSPQDVADKLREAVAATRQSLKEVHASVNEIMEDPTKMKTIVSGMDELSEELRLLDQDNSGMPLLRADAVATDKPLARGPRDPQSMQLARTSNEESLKTMMQFTDNMCSVLDNALATISQDEYELAAQLSLGIAQKLLEAGQAMFTSIGDETRQEAGIHGDRSDRITIEELPDDDEHTKQSKQQNRHIEATERLRKKREQRKQAQAVRSYLVGLADTAQKRAVDHPAAAALIGTISLPFIGLAIPLASLIGLALVVEKYFPEHTALTLELCANFVQMAKLWFLLVKISARQIGSVAKQCLIQWQDHAATHGYVATGKEIISTGLSLSWMCVTYLYASLLSTSSRLPAQ